MKLHSTFNGNETAFYSQKKWNCILQSINKKLHSTVKKNETAFYSQKM